MPDQEENLGSPTLNTLSENILVYKYGVLAEALVRRVPALDDHLEKDESSHEDSQLA
jgi:hypothetical protein